MSSQLALESALPSLRRTAATWLMQAGVPIGRKRAWAGGASIHFSPFGVCYSITINT